MPDAERDLGPAVQARDLEKVYGSGPTAVRALAGLDLAVPRGQFVAVMGPSGSGKSTLLHMLAALDTPTRGSIAIGDVAIDRLDQNQAARFRRRHIGVVFQFFNLIPSLNVEENVALPLLLEGRRLSEVEEGVESLIEVMGLENRRSNFPSTLSGGEMQRVAIARALLTQPMLLLADEPTGNLDSKTAEEILALLRRSTDERGVTTLIVTHDLRAASYADRIVELRDGRITDDLPAWRPASTP